MREQMNIVIVGHVDHGKSTIIGRLLADTGSLPEGKLEQIKTMCELNSKPFEYAFLLDALKDERSQGITIDSARVFFKTKKRDYIIIDAPGHIEFLKNMVSGAARAEAALLVIDAKEGVQENSRRHGYFLSMLGIKQVAVVVNKMDLVGYDKTVYDNIVGEYRAFLNNIDLKPVCFIPSSGKDGESIAFLNGNMPWYNGSSVLQVLDNFSKEASDISKPFRMPVQDVYKFTKMNDQRRIVVGTIESGQIQTGDELIFLPSGKKTRIKSIEVFNAPVRYSAKAGQAVGFTLEEQIYVTRGEIAAKVVDEKPHIAKRFRTNLFWLSKNPLVKDKNYILKLGTAKINVKLEEIIKVVNASDLSVSTDSTAVQRHEVAECILSLNKPIAFDKSELIAITGRYVIIDNYQISGGGKILEALDDKLSWVRDRVNIRNLKWEKSILSDTQRAEKYNQKSRLILITGPKGSGKKELAKELESRLFKDGKIVYFLGIGNLLYGVDADIKKNSDHKEEHLRRLAEVAHILLDAGIILIVTAIELNQYELEIIKTTVNYDKIETVWTGEDLTTDISYDLRVPGIMDLDESVNMIVCMLQNKGVIFSPW
jgi:bifunctional enzyme CysN/CysC